MRTAIKSILICLFIQTSAILSNNSQACAQALYTNPDTIQQYLKDRIKDVKEQLKTRIDALEWAYEDIKLYSDVKESYVIDDPFSNMKPVAVYRKDDEGKIHFRWIN